jgi:hypothetical protein
MVEQGKRQMLVQLEMLAIHLLLVRHLCRLEAVAQGGNALILTRPVVQY